MTPTSFRYRFLATALLLGSLSLTPAVSLAQDSATAPLMEQARQLEERGRDDLALRTWERVLALEPDNTQALERLIVLYSRAGDSARASQLRERLMRAAPDSTFLRDLRITQTRDQEQRELLARARAAGREQNFAQAADDYARYQELGPVAREVAIEVYEGMAGSDRHLATALQGLKQLIADDASNPSARLALARVQSYRPATRRGAIDTLFALVDDPAVGTQARKDLRQALVWLEAGPGDRPRIQRYLQQIDGGDDAVRAKLQTLDRQASNQQVARIQAEADAGYAHLDDDDVAAAREVFEALREQHPRSGVPLAGLGVVALREDDPQEALRLLERANTLSPAQAAGWRPAFRSARFFATFQRAEALRTAGDTQAALASYRAAFADPPAALDPALRVSYADMLRQAGARREAEQQLRQALNDEPGQRDARRLLATLLLEEDRIDEADALAAGDISIAALVRPAQAQQLREQAQRQFDEGRLDAAAALLSDAVTLAPQDPWPRLDLARVYRAQGRPDDALMLLQSLQRTLPDNLDVRKALAYHYAEEQDWAATLDALESIPPRARDAALTDVQKRSWVQYQLQRAEQAAQHGEWAIADQAMSSVARAVGNDTAYFADLARGWAALGDNARAVSYMRQMLQEDDVRAPQRLQYAGMLLAMDLRAEFEAVVTHLQDSDLSAAEREQLAALVSGYRVARADEARNRGDLAEAYRYLRDVIAQRPEDTDATLALARVFAAAGDTDAARNLYTRVLAADPENITARLGRAQVAVSRGDPDARALLRDVGRAIPADPRYFALEAEYAQSEGLTARALRFTEKARAQTLAPMAPISRPPTLTRLTDAPDGPRAVDTSPLALRPGAFVQPVSPVTQPSLFADLTPLALRDLPAVSAPRPASARRSGGAVPRRGAPVMLQLAPELRPRFSAATANPAPASRGLAALTPAEADALEELRAAVSARAQADVSSRVRQGEAGFSRLAEFVLPVAIFSRATEWGTVGLEVTPTTLSAGNVSGDRRDRLGTRALISGGDEDSIALSDSGIGGRLLYDFGRLSGSIGVSPLGFEEDRLIGHVRWAPNWG
ncbi:MAG: tetratricopeptide repeat protein, partial [Oceanococcaceae bacterium]